MRCPFCNFEDTQVKDSRHNDSKISVRRRRFCPKCSSRFTTVERVQLRELFVIKRSGLKKPFEREKIAHSINAAVRKRNITQDQINAIADDIFRELENSGIKEVPTRIIGEMIMKALAKIDEVAYIRFASVYKEFSSAVDFANFIKRLKT